MSRDGPKGNLGLEQMIPYGIGIGCVGEEWQWPERWSGGNLKRIIISCGGLHLGEEGLGQIL